jgi:hypothetical protein
MEISTAFVSPFSKAKRGEHPPLPQYIHPCNEHDKTTTLIGTPETGNLQLICPVLFKAVSTKINYL